jgi:hypothetical protein
MRPKKYIIKLTESEREQLRRMLRVPRLQPEV